ncbi:MAG: CoA-binding protein [Gammaproteobacteria bacterium]|nr:MAG: CoA-binding protein [Gammaproteobacteria bacterium]
MSALDPVLNPSSIVIVGASNQPTKRGYQAIRKLQEAQFAGEIYGVNPRGGEVLGVTCYAAIDALPVAPDLALICTPAATVPGLIEACGQKGIKGAIVLAGGFSEAGDEGAALERAMVRAARKWGIRVIGPNTSGSFNATSGLNLVGYERLPQGRIGLLSQSGNMALTWVTEALARPWMGFSTYVGVGNESEVGFHEYLEYFQDDPHTSVVLAYVEGLRNGRAFLEAARRTTPTKPVVLYKSGRTQHGQRAAKSHTGALAGDYSLSRHVLKQAGVIVVEQSDRVLDVADTLARQPALLGKRVAVLADGGGHATITADLLTDFGLQLADLLPETQARLKAALVPQAAVANPVDVAGATDAQPAKFAEAAALLLADPNVDGLIVVGLFGGYHIRFDSGLKDEEIQTAEKLAELAATHGKPMLVHSVYADHRPVPLATLQASDIPVFNSLEKAVHSLSALAEYGASLKRASRSDGAPGEAIPLLAGSDQRNLIDHALKEGRKALFEHEAKQLLAGYGVPVPSQFVLKSLDELPALLPNLPAGPLAVKLVSPDILHKSDAGGVVLNVQGEAALREAFTRIMDNARAYDPQAELTGVLITPMVEPGLEVILGVTRDPQFGPVLMFGLGGIHVEVLKDVVFRALPLTADDAADMLGALRASALLDGVRGQPAVDKQALIDLMLRVSRMCLNHEEIIELDLNPVRVYREGIAVVDARIVINEKPVTLKEEVA